MKRLLLPFTLLFFFCSIVQAQRKSDLIAEIEALKIELDSTKNIVVEAKKNERVGLARAESFEKQVSELQDANATLLKNLNSFASISNTNSENLNRALAKIEEKENQLQAITNSIAAHDSTALVLLTNAKQSLGENARIAVGDGKVVISSKLEQLFESATGPILKIETKDWLSKIASILKANPNTQLTIEGLSMTGELDLAENQANALGSLFTSEFAIERTKVITLGKDGNLKEGINFILHPDYTSFYSMVKESMKASN